VVRSSLALLFFAVSAAPELNAQTSAVLPFANRITDQSAIAQNAAAQMDWIGESIAETLRDALSSRGVVTLNRQETSAAYRQLNLRPRVLMTQASALKIGEALDAEQVVYGTFEFTADEMTAGATPSRSAVPAGVTPATPAVRGTLKITARVFDRRRLKQSPEFLESGNLDNLPVLEAHLAWRALALIAPSLAPPEADFRSLRTPIRLDALENFIRGLLASAPAQQEKYFLQSARLDSRFGHPLYFLGRIHYDRKEYRQAAEWLQKISDADVHYREASFLLGLALYQSGDFPGANKTFQTLADAVPLGEVFNNLGATQSRRNLPQALDSFRKALDGDPNDSDYLFNYGYALWRKGDFTAAAERFRAVLDRNTGDQTATILLGACLKKQGPRPGDARLDAVERLKSNFEERAYQLLRALVEPAR